MKSLTNTNKAYHELRVELASWLKHIAKLEEAPSIAIMLILKTPKQILTMIDYIDKHKAKKSLLNEEYLSKVAIAISEQVE